MGYDVTRFQGDVDEDLICPICSGVLEEPVQVSWVDDRFGEAAENIHGKWGNGEVPAQAPAPTLLAHADWRLGAQEPRRRHQEEGRPGSVQSGRAEVQSVQVFFGGELFMLSDGQLFVPVLLTIAWQLLFLFRGSN